MQTYLIVKNVLPRPSHKGRVRWWRHGVCVEQRHIRLSGSSDPAQPTSDPSLVEGLAAMPLLCVSCLCGCLFK